MSCLLVVNKYNGKGKVDSKGEKGEKGEKDEKDVKYVKCGYFIRFYMIAIFTNPHGPQTIPLEFAMEKSGSNFEEVKECMQFVSHVWRKPKYFIR